MRTTLIDGNNVLARCDFAAKNKGVAMSVGETNTSALVLFVNMISKYVRLTTPTNLAVLWDAGHDFRDEAYPEYKANRVKHIEGSDDLPPFQMAKEFLTLAGVPHKAHRGWEADDLIAATARQTQGEVSIISGDKDLLQLIGLDLFDVNLGLPDKWRRVVQYRVPDDTPWTAERYQQEYGYPPHQAAMVHALVGDTSDNVPGLRGIGPKKAVALLEKVHWDWEALLVDLGPEKAATASTMRILVDLREADYPSWFMQAHRGAPAWSPTPIGVDSMLSHALLEFCERYSLRVILERLRDGSLWVDHRASSEGIFDLD